MASLIANRKYFTVSLGIANCIEQAVKNLGYGALKEEQTEAISQFVSGRDVFVALPTG